MSRRPGLTARERFFEKVDITPGCWEWKASRNAKGYGQVGIPGQRRTTLAHRVSWELHHGQPPGELWVLHKCDNPPCVNPDHLFLGTNADNQADMHSKGRGVQRVGEAHGMSRLTMVDVLEMRRLRETGKTYSVIASAFGVHTATAHNAIVGNTWRHVR